MARLSIRETVHCTFSSYKKHLKVLVTSGIIVTIGSSILAVCSIVVLDGVSVREALSSCPISKKATIMEAIFLTTDGLRLGIPDGSNLQHLLLSILMELFSWCIALLLCCGIIRIVLHIKNHDNAALSLFVYDKKILFSVIGIAGILYVYSACMKIGILALAPTVVQFMLDLCCVQFSDQVFNGVSELVIHLGFGFWIIGYMFSFFCIVDAPKLGARKALLMSQTIVSGFRIKLMAAVIVLVCIVIPLGFFLKNLLLMIGPSTFCFSKRILMGGLLLPIIYVYLGYLYCGLSAR